jgi:hypothetical protein
MARFRPVEGIAKSHIGESAACTRMVVHIEYVLLIIGQPPSIEEPMLSRGLLGSPGHRDRDTQAFFRSDLSKDTLVQAQHAGGSKTARRQRKSKQGSKGICFPNHMEGGVFTHASLTQVPCQQTSQASCIQRDPGERWQN